MSSAHHQLSVGLSKGGSRGRGGVEGGWGGMFSQLHSLTTCEISPHRCDSLHPSERTSQLPEL